MRERLPIPVVEIICALEREAANTDTDPRWLAARCLRSMDQWETRTLMCRVDTRSTPETPVARIPALPISAKDEAIVDGAVARRIDPMECADCDGLVRNGKLEHDDGCPAART